MALARDDTLRSQANGDHGLKPMLLSANEIKTDDPWLLGSMTKVTRNDSCTKSQMRPPKTHLPETHCNPTRSSLKKGVKKLLVTLLLFMVHESFGQEPAANLDILQTTYDLDIASLEEHVVNTQRSLHSEYTNNLAKLVAVFSEKTFLEGVLATQKEQQRFTTHRSVTPKDVNKDIAHLARLQSEFIEAQGSIEKGFQAEIKKIAHTHYQALIELQKNLLRKSDVPGAVAASDAAKKIKAAAESTSKSVAKLPQPNPASNHTNNSPYPPSDPDAQILVFSRTSKGKYKDKPVPWRTHSKEFIYRYRKDHQGEKNVTKIQAAGKSTPCYIDFSPITEQHRGTLHLKVCNDRSGNVLARVLRGEGDQQEEVFKQPLKSSKWVSIEVPFDHQGVKVLGSFYGNVAYEWMYLTYRFK